MYSPIVGLLLILTLSLAVFFAWGPIVRTYEDIVFALGPSAERAFAYGERHFSSSDQAEYDVNRAEYFFEQAAAKDPTIPYLYHELGRISFLKGNFSKALSQIDLQISLHGNEAQNSYYVRGLIEGYMGSYEASIADYEHFLRYYPDNWAAINDYAWVLLKADRPRDAVVASAGGLALFPNNAWLLNTNAIGLYELGLYESARDQTRKAAIAASKVTEAEWLTAYPGNDPAVAQEGIAAFQEAALRNMHSISLALASSTVQSRYEY